MSTSVSTETAGRMLAAFARVAALQGLDVESNEFMLTATVEIVRATPDDREGAQAILEAASRYSASLVEALDTDPDTDENCS